MKCFLVKFVSNPVRFLRYFRDPIRAPESGKLNIGSLESLKIGSLQVHTGYLTFFFKKTESSKT